MSTGETGSSAACAEIHYVDSILSPDGWPYASSPPVGPGDPGRFHALFGRDSLITALALLPARPDIARATLRVLGRLQGRREDRRTDEQPGKICHEYWPRAPRRLIAAGFPVRDGSVLYYGSADATPWFLLLLASLGDEALTTELEAQWRAAGDWLLGALESGGGYLRYGPDLTHSHLTQQGWRDTSDPADAAFNGGGILRADGSAPTSPVADADCQAVAIVALRALASLSADDAHARAARELTDRVATDFGPETMALEGDGRPVWGAGSQLGRLLWASALPVDAAESVADRLEARDVLTPSGVRTLSADHPVFDGESYSRGGVWAYDSWLAWGGLRAAGHEEAAARLRTGVLAALDHLDGAPELYAVTPDGPRQIDHANRVQAWTIGSRWALKNCWDGRADRLFAPSAPIAR